MMNNFDLVQLL